MPYQVGDQVIHWTHGPGKIINLDVKRIEGQSRLYYVVEAGRTTIWVPVDNSGEDNLRQPKNPKEFSRLLEILQTPANTMPDHHHERLIELSKRMQKKSLEEVCAIIRDLVYRSHSKKLTRNDLDILKRAEEFLLNEWELALGIPRENAWDELQGILSNVSQA